MSCKGDMAINFYVVIKRSSCWQGKIETEYNKMVVFHDISYITNTPSKTLNERVS